MAAGRRILGRYSAAGGGLLANGLAYAALFALVPAVLLAVAAAGIVFGDPGQRAAAVAVIGQVVPPLRDVVDAVLVEAERSPGALGVVGLVTLAWGASRFVVAFSDAIRRVMGRTAHRGFVAQNAMAIAAVLLLVLAVLAAPTVAGLAGFVDAAEASGAVALLGGALHLALGAIPPIATIGATVLTFRVVPLPPPGWRALGLPALVTGVVLTILVQAFVFLAPRLIGFAALLGTIATVFAALAWLALSFQALLIGAAWAADREANARTPPGSGGLAGPAAPAEPGAR